MSEDETEPVSEVEEKEQADEQQTESPRQVPLEALQAERKKRQEIESNFHAYKELVERLDREKAQKQEPEEDEEELVSKRDLKAFQKNLTTEQFAALKRDIAEETYKESNPQAIKEINTHLKQILEQKPWLADTIEKATNRYARAYEIVNDYRSLVTTQNVQKKQAEKIIDNAKKPGNPASTAKASQLSGADYLKSIAGTGEFRDYRKKLLGR